MNIQSRLFRSSLSPIWGLVFVVAFIAMACSNSQPVTPQTPKVSANQSQKSVDYPQTPLATHVVYSPLIGSGGTPAAPAVTPRVEITVNPETLKVGEQVTVTVHLGDIDPTVCYLFVRDRGASEVSYTVGVSADNEVIMGTNTSQVLELVSTTGGNGQAIFTLRGLGQGSAKVWVSAIPGGSTAGNVVTGDVSQKSLVTVEK
jgi:hypothetical protein